MPPSILVKKCLESARREVVLTNTSQPGQGTKVELRLAAK
jgi:hypothetical protein